ncbi:MAG: methionyl-tRNA formyltransferase [Myxococcota bacterium]|nr:methionyl-tRNA formyltransferase [Myxococcota bacterium]
MSLRAVFFGSPLFAVPSLEALAGIADVVGVVCQPDKPAGRGLALAAPAVKIKASEMGLQVVQPTKLRTGDFAAWLRAQAADVALVVAYGRILPGEVLSVTRLGCVNVHASLLPRYRGAAPIAWAIANGETETGITLMQLDEGMDTGPIFARVTTRIGPDETCGELSRRLAVLGADAAREWLPRYVAGRAPLEVQDGDRATMAPMLTKENGRIDWSSSARRVHDHVRAMNPWPGAFTIARGRRLKVHSTRVIAGGRPAARPGEVVIADKSRVIVACGEGSVLLSTVQPEGRRAFAAPEWVAGRGVEEGDVLGP